MWFGLGPGGGGVSAMLTRDHPGLSWFPQDLRNPGAALRDRPVGEALHRDATSAQEVRSGLPGTAEMLGGLRVPQISPRPQLLSQSCLSVPSRAWTPHRLEASPGPAGVPFCFSKDWCVEECSCFSCLTRVPRSLQDTSRVLLQRPQPPTAVISCPVPWNPRRLGNTGMCDA